MKNKFKIIDGSKYSKIEFDSYEHRVKIECHTMDDIHVMDVYTDEKNSIKIYTSIKKLVTDKVINLNILNVSTKEQDEKSNALLQEWIDTGCKLGS